MKRTAIWIPTWQCGNDCIYCDYRFRDNQLECFGQSFAVGEPLTGEQWTEQFSRLGLTHLEVTGGEPTLYPDLAKTLNGLPPGMTWAITSNTLRIPEDMPIENCVGWTSSYHYRDTERFRANLERLNQLGFKTAVTLVAYPEEKLFRDMLLAIEQFRNRCRSVRIHPYLHQGYDWQFAPDLKKSLVLLRPYLAEPAPPTSWTATKWARCSAGSDYALFFPDGSVYRCYSAILRGKSISQIAEFEWSAEPVPCGEDCVFPCDANYPSRYEQFT